ncbi:hypothetical protein H0H87_006161 [Tephrocybe sp. NHM501043]|nr:hypothetical protein H0H87_006161 [Tephrocybe sp. NHM501043]
MAVLAPRDWQQQQVYQTPMDGNSSNPRQRSPPVADSQHHHPQQQQQHHQPAFSYPVQQPQGSWTPSIAAAPFYPSFYQNHHQQGPQQQYPVQIPQQQPYFDPANAQLAQWAYQQMMFNAQHGFPQQQQQQRNNDYFAQNQLAQNFNPFPSGTPPPHQNHRGGAADHQQQPGQQNQFNGFHPYRRPSRQPQAQSPDVADRRQVISPPPPNPPYKRPEASGSSSSVNSTGSRQRTNSNQSGHSGHNTPSANVNGRVRNASPSILPNRHSPPPASSSVSSSSGQLRVPHHRAGSSSSTNSARPSGISPSPPSSTTTTSSATASSTPTITSTPSATPRPVRPSPLSQGNFTANERRMSRDDSDPMLDPIPSASMLRSGGLKGRLRRALSFNAAQALKEEETSDDESIKASKLKAKTPVMSSSSSGKSTGSPSTVRGSTDGIDDASSTATVQTKKRGRAASLFNAKMNLSTDNISLSSTVSSASVMIRKLGSMGKLAKRNSLAGITSLFKDKDKKKKDKDGKNGTAKAEASEASVSHVTAELDRSSDWTVGTDMNGLSPAAKLARQHTLKSNAEAAAKAKAAQEAAAAASNASATSNVSSAQVTTNGANGVAGVPTWDKNTTTRYGSASLPVKGGSMRVNEDGTRVMVEDEDDESDDGHFDGRQQTGQAFHADGWVEDDDDWDVEGDQDEDTTIRVGLERTSLDDEGYGAQDDIEPWAINARRSVERSRRPAKGILKHADSYDQHIYLTEAPNANRVRSNSYNSHPGHTPELGPLARIPSPDPDHIDGLHKHPHSSHNTPSNVTAPFLPPLSFDTSMSMDSPTKDSPLPPTPTNASHNQNPLASHPPEKSNTIFNHPNLNSSAPALSTMTTTPVMLRSATAPAKRLIFDNNLSVYDTFPASVYDRRSEPATWSRLTPALAQRIKEELNSYKMEEMEVHAASRIQCVVFRAPCFQLD